MDVLNSNNEQLWTEFSLAHGISVHLVFVVCVCARFSFLVRIDISIRQFRYRCVTIYPSSKVNLSHKLCDAIRIRQANQTEREPIKDPKTLKTDSIRFIFQFAWFENHLIRQNFVCL